MQTEQPFLTLKCSPGQFVVFTKNFFIIDAQLISLQLLNFITITIDFRTIDLTITIVLKSMLLLIYIKWVPIGIFF